MTRRVFMLALLLSIGLISFSAFAQQETGQIVGTVTDPNGAAVTGATISVKSLDASRGELTATTNSEGAYIITNLQPGLYEITTTAQGFQTQIEKAQITVGVKLTVKTQLAIGGGTVTVNIVAGGVAEINTVDQQLSNVVGSKQITELPTLTRNPYDLVGLSGNASDADPSGSTGRGAGFSINGQRSSSTDILLDGAENVDVFVAGIGQSTPLDSVGEFRVITGDFSAENGRASGGIVNAITRSGTNEFHGTAYEFNRISRLAANTFDNNARGNKRGVFTRNQFGYSIGGPILKSKLTFFNSTEWTRVRSSDTLTVWVPTQGFINASAPATQAYMTKFGAFGPGVTPTGATFGTRAGVVGPLFQQVRFTIPTDAGGGTPQNTYQTVTRVDWNFSNKTQVYGRYARESDKFTPGNYDVSPYAGFTVGTTNLNQNMLVNVTHQFSSRFVSQTKLAYNRLLAANTVGSDPNTPTLSGNFAAPGGLTVFFPGFISEAPGVGLPTSGPQNVGQVNEDLSYTMGNHNFRFGGQYVYIQDNVVFPAYQNASEVLGSTQTSVVNNFFNGQLQGFTAAIDPQGKFPGGFVNLPVHPPDFSRSNRYNEYALYFNDSWRVRPRLTLSLGVRYEYYGVQHNKNPAVESNVVLGTGATLQERVHNETVVTTPNSGGLWKPDKNNFAPRVGFAWDVKGDGKTSIRGGYGLAYERNFGNVTFNVIQNPPAYAVLALTQADIPGLPIFTTSAGPLAGTVPPTKQLPRVSLRAVDPNIVNSYSHLWSASFEHQLMKDTVVSLTYSGSAGRKLYSIGNLNRVNSAMRFLGGPTTCPALAPTFNPVSNRLNCQYNDENFRGNFGYSNYNGVTAALDSNNLFGLGLTITNRYTYSVARDNTSSTFTDGYQSNNGYRLGFTDPYNPSLDYGYADFDVRNRFTSGFVWELPFFKNASSSWARNVARGWSLTGRAQINSGAPFTVFDCTNEFRAYTCIRLQPTGNINYGKPGTLVGTGNPNEFTWFDASGQTKIGTYADPYPAPGSFGTDSGPYPGDMAPRNAFRGPGFWNVDLGLYKSINITEKYKLQLRGEFFNVFNHPSLAINGATTDVEAGNTTVSKTGHRNVQLALKFIF